MTEKDGIARQVAQVVDEVQTRYNAPTLNPLSPDAWFLGAQGENEDLLRGLLNEALTGHVRNRKAYSEQFNDPEFLYEGDQDDDAYKVTSAALLENLKALNDKLKGSIPVASYRNQSHMYWDVTIPGVAGYIAGMLHNQNQAGAEGSPVTTAIEYAVGQQLCEMLGYDLEGKVKPWGHITMGGSIANIEATWAARNMRFQALALAHATRTIPAMSEGAKLPVKTAEGRATKLGDLTAWDAVNIPVDDALALPNRLTAERGVKQKVVEDALKQVSIQYTGVLDFFRQHLPQTPSPAIIVPATAHYSWPRGAGITGLGIHHMVPVEVDLEGRMDPIALRRTLDQCLEERRPVVMVVAVIGTTRESAVDPIDEIARIRDEYRDQGLDFVIHADAAWGGYFRSMLVWPKGDGAGSPGSRLSDYVERQFDALAQADSITVDPHKAGFLPYPAGALCYRNEALPQMISVTADMVSHDGAALTMGSWAIAGSSPGASSTGVYLSHLSIPPDQSGYGHLLSRCVYNAKRFYAALVSMNRPEDPYEITVFKRLPSEIAGKTPVEINEEKALIADKIAGYSNETLLAKLDEDDELRKLFEEIGPDLTVVNYAFNFRTADGLNTDVDLAYELNLAIFKACSIEENRTCEVPKQTLILTEAAFDPAVYGPAFCDTFALRMGLTPKPDAKIAYLISTMQNAWISNTARGNFIPKLIDALRDVVDREVVALIHRHGLTPMPKKDS